MKKFIVSILLFTLAGLAGCHREPDSQLAANDQPITVEAWKELEVAEKYAPETFDRLKRRDPKLEEEQNWHLFMRDVVVPERRKDIPTEY